MKTETGLSISETSVSNNQNSIKPKKMKPQNYAEVTALIDILRSLQDDLNFLEISKEKITIVGPDSKERIFLLYESKKIIELKKEIETKIKEIKKQLSEL